MTARVPFAALKASVEAKKTDGEIALELGVTRDCIARRRCFWGLPMGRPTPHAERTLAVMAAKRAKGQGFDDCAVRLVARCPWPENLHFEDDARAMRPEGRFSGTKPDAFTGYREASS